MKNIEPKAAEIYEVSGSTEEAAMLYSIAISMKRIADEMASGQLNLNIYNAIAEGMYAIGRGK